LAVTISTLLVFVSVADFLYKQVEIFLLELFGNKAF